MGRDGNAMPFRRIKKMWVFFFRCLSVQRTPHNMHRTSGSGALVGGKKMTFTSRRISPTNSTYVPDSTEESNTISRESNSLPFSWYLSRVKSTSLPQRIIPAAPPPCVHTYPESRERNSQIFFTRGEIIRGFIRSPDERASEADATRLTRRRVRSMEPMETTRPSFCSKSGNAASTIISIVFISVISP
jgi:hypothetical protein